MQTKRGETGGQRAVPGREFGAGLGRRQVAAYPGGHDIADFNLKAFEETTMTG